MDISRAVSALKKYRFRDYVITFVIVAIVLNMLISPKLLPRRAIRMVHDSTINTYDAMFTRQNMIYVSDGSFARYSTGRPLILEATFQLNAREIQQLLAANHILSCETYTNCSIEDFVGVLNSAGDWRTSADYNGGTTEVYIDTKTNKATWVIWGV